MKIKRNLKKEHEENFDKLNKEKESLVKDLKNKTKNEDDLKRKLFQNENDYTLLSSKYEKIFSSMDEVLVEKDKIHEREKSLNEELKLKESRIKVKDEEVTEKMNEIEKLKKQIEDANFNIKNSNFYEQQYNETKTKLDDLHSKHNTLVKDLNNSKTDNYELEQDIMVLEKEIKVLAEDRDLAKSKIIPKEKIDQLRHDNQSLNKELDQKEKQLKIIVNDHNKLKKNYNEAMNNFNKLKKYVNNKLNEIRLAYNRDLEKERERLTKTISPGDLKAIGVLLENLDVQDYENVDYDSHIKDLRKAREKFRNLAEDPNTDFAKKLLYNHLDKVMQYRIDFLNLQFGKPIETLAGRDYLIRSDNSWSPLGF